MYFKKNILILPPQKNILILPPKKYLNIAPSKNVFQNYCKLSIENKNTRYVNYSILKKCYIKKTSSFEITQDYIIIFLEIIRRKQTSKINQTYTSKHKINESNTKVSTHY